MNTRKNKIIVSALTLGLLTPMVSASAFAEENNSTISAPSINNVTQVEQPIMKVLKDDSNEKIVESKDNNLVSISTYDKKSKILRISTKKLIDSSVTTETINLQNANKSFVNKSQRANWEMEVLDHASSLDGRWEYTYYKGDVWLIRIPSVNYAKNPQQNSENKADLNGFRTAVNNLMTNEVTFLSKFTGEAALGCLALLTTPTPWTVVSGAAAAIGLAAWAVPDFYKVFVEVGNANYYFHQVKTN